ncbi:hypothetical protein [Burkholderia ambifaria]|uniref:hypothetical protein n=1 Tax=Burkholderia ambifaria TaxID=152480 RepID=UPI002FE3C9F2
MRELNNQELNHVSGAGVSVDGGIIGSNGGGLFVGIGQGANVTINGKPVTPNSSSADGLSISVGTGHWSPFSAGWYKRFFNFF